MLAFIDVREPVLDSIERYDLLLSLIPAVKRISRYLPKGSQNSIGFERRNKFLGQFILHGALQMKRRMLPDVATTAKLWCSK
jgi:hypothetical protein